MSKVKVEKIKTQYVFIFNGKAVGYIAAYSEKQAWLLWKRGHGRHLYPGLCQVESILDHIQIKASSPAAVFSH